MKDNINFVINQQPQCSFKAIVYNKYIFAKRFAAKQIIETIMISSIMLHNLILFVLKDESTLSNHVDQYRFQMITNR